MALQRSLGADAFWHQVLPVLGIDAKPSPMPMLVRCPHCDSPRMRIYDDTRNGGHWHYCPGCKSAGDMIELAARTWKCNLQQAVTRLITAGVPLPEESASNASMEPYTQWVLGIQQRSRTLLATGAEALALGHVNPGYVIQQLGLLKDQNKPYWRRRMGRFMAGCTRSEALGLTNPKKVARGVPFATGKFEGKGWGPLVAVPFQDLPNHYAGWLFVGRQARPSLDYEFLVLDSGAYDPAKKTDIGVCMYDVLDSSTAYSELFGNTVFVFNDPIHALKLQSRHMRDTDLPLPLVSTYNVKIKRKYNLSTQSTWELVTRGLWHTRPDKKFVFWSATVTPDVFNNAARADGSIHICKTLLVTSRNPAHIWLQIIQRNARPWMEVLEHELLKMDEGTACDFVANLDIVPDQMQQFMHICDDKLRTLLESNRSQVRPLTVATVNGKRICETAAGWTLEKTGELISNAIVRIDKIVSHADEDDPYYVGRIIVDGKEAQFSTPFSILTGKTPGNWLHNKIVRALGKAPILKRAWYTHILDVARQFHEPQVICEDGQFGWKPADACFSLPQFSVHIGGNVVTEPAHVLDNHAPGMHLWPPSPPPPEIVRLARECVQNELFWAMTACIGANIVAPAVGQPLANIGAIGHTATGMAYAIARRAGCATIDACNTLMRPNEFVDQLDNAMRRHNYPIMLRTMQVRQTRRGLERWLNSTCAPNGIVVLPEPLQMLAPVLAPWRFINIPNDLDLSAEAQLYGDLVIPLWLQRLCRQKLELESDSDSFVLQVLDDMAAMMEDLGGNAGNIRVASRHIDDATAPGEPGARLAALLYGAIEDGIAKFAEQASSGKPTILHVWDPDALHGGIFLGSDVLNDILDAYDLFIPSPGAITDALTVANALDCRCEYNGSNGWLIIDRWWHRQIERCRANRKRLTVIGGA